jgi:hypothetical protein
VRHLTWFDWNQAYLILWRSSDPWKSISKTLDLKLPLAELVWARCDHGGFGSTKSPLLRYLNTLAVHRKLTRTCRHGELVHTLPKTNCTSVCSCISLFWCHVHVMYLLMNASFYWHHLPDHIQNCCTARMMHVTYVTFCNWVFLCRIVYHILYVWCWFVWQHKSLEEITDVIGSPTSQIFYLCQF